MPVTGRVEVPCINCRDPLVFKVEHACAQNMARIIGFNVYTFDLNSLMELYLNDILHRWVDILFSVNRDLWQVVDILQALLVILISAVHLFNFGLVFNFAHHFPIVFQHVRHDSLSRSCHHLYTLLNGLLTISLRSVLWS